jgi:site-specific recombinase XerD
LRRTLSQSIHDIEAENILKFLDYLEHKRENKCETVNSRLAAIKSFWDYVSYECPEYLEAVRKVKMIPARKTYRREVGYLTKDEIDALLNACDMTTGLGRRDYLIVLLLFNFGMRVSEMAALKCSDVVSHNGQCTLRILGKGRKERIIPLWETTQKSLYSYIQEHGICNDDYLLSGRNVPHLSRSGIRYRIDCLVTEALKTCSSLKGKNITPHVFRHSSAMSLLQAGVDISTIAIWLGHESIETTHKYMTADITIKEKALARVSKPQNNCGNVRYHAAPNVMRFLDSL